VGVLVYFFYKFLFSDRFNRWSIGLEAAGWFDAASYKRSQGHRVRRLTTFGLLILFGSGIYTMVFNNVIGVSELTLNLPFTNASFAIIPHAQTVIPVVLFVLSLWFAWRIVNYPIFADFLIATEAEINKVSWTPRARLIQDTIVVLVTVTIITVFLFIADYFWATSLSQIGIIPSGSDKSADEKGKPANPNDLGY
jgi:preprotein translocase SecE subunit